MSPDAEPPGVEGVEAPIHGVAVDGQGRCAHYAGDRDVVAIRFPCCGRYYACHECHREVEDHEPVRWTDDDFQEEAVLCGACRNVLTVRAYLTGRGACPNCGAAFNPACASHHEFYFELERG